MPTLRLNSGNVCTVPDRGIPLCSLCALWVFVLKPSGSRRRLATASTSGSGGYPAWGLSWSYDDYGNRTAQSVTAGSGPSNSVSVSTSTNRITGMGGYTFYYDSSGNLTQDDLYKYKYDAEHRLVETRDLSNNLIATYAYDQRHFGATADPGLWAGAATYAADARAVAQRLGHRHADRDQDRERYQRPRDFDQGVFMELRGLVAGRFAMFEDRIEHETEYADENEKTYDRDDRMQVIYLFAQLRVRRLQVELVFRPCRRRPQPHQSRCGPLLQPLVAHSSPAHKARLIFSSARPQAGCAIPAPAGGGFPRHSSGRWPPPCRANAMQHSPLRC